MFLVWSGKARSRNPMDFQCRKSDEWNRDWASNHGAHLPLAFLPQHERLARPLAPPLVASIVSDQTIVFCGGWVRGEASSNSHSLWIFVLLTCARSKYRAFTKLSP